MDITIKLNGLFIYGVGFITVGAAIGYVTGRLVEKTKKNEKTE